MMRLGILLWLTCAAGLASAQNVLTANYDNARTSANLNETILTPSALKGASFGKLFALPVDGQIYAQPLYLGGVVMPGPATHNVVYVATAHNSVYAFDADVPGPPLWTVNLGPSVPSNVYQSDEGVFTDILPEIGITGTPVIDPSTGTLYVVAATYENGNFFYRLHALDTATGVERFGAPVEINAKVQGTGDSSVNGMVPFVAGQHLQRPGLLLVNGVVYVAFGSHGDYAPYHGWIYGFTASNVQQQAALFNATPNGTGGAFWQSGRGLAADNQGNIFAVSSNGDTDETSNFSDNVLRLNASNLAVMDWFAPFNVQYLNDNDEDLGACGAMLIPGTNLLVAGGKQGYMYLMSTQNMGGMTPGNGQILQSFNAVDSGGVFNIALWNRSDGPLLYVHGINAPVVSYRLKNNSFSRGSQGLVQYDVPFQGMTISANGSHAGSGILWMTTADSWPLPAAGTLHAYIADNLSTELWNSSTSSADSLGVFNKFTNPTVANGKVYAPSGSNQLVVYGLTSKVSTSNAPVITGVVNAASYAAGALAPGELVAIFGQNLGPKALAYGAFDANGNLNADLAGSEVTFNGVAAPLLYTSANQLAAVVPFEIQGSSTVMVQAGYNGVLSVAQSFPVTAAAPGVFALDASGRGAGVILNQDYSVNSPSNPASAGSVVMVYATGGGQTNPGDFTGAVAPGDPVSLAANATATVGGQPASVTYAGNAPGQVSGVIQVNIQLPASFPQTGSIPLVLTVNGAASQQTITIAVQ
jgi:uncharacterized protein (TIGR03437 family)